MTLDLDAIVDRTADRDLWTDLVNVVDELRVARKVIEFTRGHDCSTRWLQPCGHQFKALAAYDSVTRSEAIMAGAQALEQLQQLREALTKVIKDEHYARHDPDVARRECHEGNCPLARAALEAT